MKIINLFIDVYIGFKFSLLSKFYLGFIVVIAAGRLIVTVPLQ